MSSDNRSLGNLIIESLTRKPNQKASDLAKELSLKKRHQSKSCFCPARSVACHQASSIWDHRSQLQ